jgi:acyl dehydratase
MRNFRRAGCFLALTLSWSLGVRFGSMILLAHPMLTRSLAGLTVVSAALALRKQWSAAPALEAGHGDAA